MARSRGRRKAPRMKAEVTRLVYSAILENETQYIDVMRGMALVNGRNYDQFENGKPLLVGASIRMNTASESVQAIKPTWAVKNAFNKANDAWKRTLKSAGLKPSQLNTYGKELRLAWDADHSKHWCEYNANAGIVDAVPDNITKVYKSDVEEAGLPIFVYSQLNWESNLAEWGASPVPSPAQFNVRAFSQTVAAVPVSDPAQDVIDKKMNVFGDVNNISLQVLDTYLDSRINTIREQDTDMDSIPTSDNDFIMMLAPGEEVADDVIDNVKVEGRWRPYTNESSKLAHDIIVPGANVAGQDTLCHIPLGLLKWRPSTAQSKLVIDILSVTPM